MKGTVNLDVMKRPKADHSEVNFEDVNWIRAMSNGWLWYTKTSSPITRE
jgi:hypothetical protein